MSQIFGISYKFKHVVSLTSKIDEHLSGHYSGFEGSHSMAWGRSRRLGGVTDNLGVGLLKAWGVIS